MWKRGGRSFALDRAQALLSAKRNSRGGVKSVQGATVHTSAVKTRFSSSNTHPSFSDLSDLSSVSSAPEHGADTLCSAAAKTQRREGDSTKHLKPQSSLGGGGSRFLKKAPPPATNSSQSPVSKSKMQQVPKHRNVSSSQQGSQTAALSRLAQIESHIHSGKQVQEHARQGQKPAENLTSDVGISPPPVAHSLEAHVQLSAQSSSDTSLKGKRFLKNVTAVAVNNSNTAAARPPKEADFGIRSRSGAADAVVPSGGLETKSIRAVSGVSLESDEEDMKKLLGDSLDSIDNNFLIPERPSFIRRADKLLSKSSQKVYSSPLPATIPSSSSPNTAPPRSPGSPSRHSSPFRFIGQAQAHFSPSVLSLSPSPPCVSPSPPLRLNSPHRVGSPQRSLSSMSGRVEVLSLSELFFVGPGSEDPHDEMSAVTSEDFKINVVTLDDLVPATLEFTEETPGKEREVKHSVPLPGSPNRHQQYKEKEKKEEQQEGALDYQSDFESESRIESKYSVNQISEHLQEDGDEEKVVPEVSEEDSDVSCERTEDNYSSTFSDTSCSCTSQTPDHSQTRRISDSRFSVSHDSRSLTRKSRRHASTRMVLKEAEVQTQPIPLSLTWPTGMATLSPAVGITNMDPTPMAAHTLSAEIVEALSTFNPAVFALNEMLKQQLAMTRCFIERGRHLHSSLVQSLGPPNYRYTMLEDTKEYIRTYRPPKLTMEEALEEVLQEMRDSHI
ncbi:hypothetical protein EPR50_G00096010 [Perca flavescens]|uniref:DUF4614 domain-containing protein n=1 Tax=Perca flavescens TaxID=8167 RepID=A0A484CZ61_PERFV|nr:uncharacterized protein C19orf44 homolog [Perca flavescens]XP_028442600.1 uncharacterized protein C19orf44 homolog [Perca flavescens]XP_028442601.1 uncharacterized protein C19orf44 homolog [Perca flavescens]TDH08264.1 hypothetical protein EPR50_G00096010 [Perca flavescens]